MILFFCSVNCTRSKFQNRSTDCVNRKRLIFFGLYREDTLFLYEKKRLIWSRVIQFNPISSVPFDTNIVSGKIKLFINHDTSFVLDNCKDYMKYVVEKEDDDKYRLHVKEDTVIFVQD